MNTFHPSNRLTIPMWCGKHSGTDWTMVQTILECTQVLRKVTASRPSPVKKVTQSFTNPIAFHKKFIATTENITDDAMKTHICTTLSKLYEMTIQILEQWIPVPLAQQGMNAIRKYAERMTLTKEIRSQSTRVALYSRGRWSGGSGDWRGIIRQKYKCTYCKMGNHTT